MAFEEPRIHNVMQIGASAKLVDNRRDGGPACCSMKLSFDQPEGETAVCTVFMDAEHWPYMQRLRDEINAVNIERKFADIATADAAARAYAEA